MSISHSKREVLDLFITLKLNKESLQDETNIRHMEIVSLDDGLIDCIRSIVGENCRISFDNYYNNSELMNFQELFPYIVKDGIVEWNVPYENVSIQEFCHTNKIDPLKDNIYVDIDDYGGGGDEEYLEIVNWIKAFLPIIGNIVSVLEIPIVIKDIIDITRGIYQHFAKNNRIPEIGDVKDFLVQNETWTKKELKKPLILVMIIF